MGMMVMNMMGIATNSMQSVAACPHIFQTFEAAIRHGLLVELEVSVIISNTTLDFFKRLRRAVRTIWAWVSQILGRRRTRAFANGATNGEL
jgi:predicted metal-dependent HD superfamily phosphohydrolase